MLKSMQSRLKRFTVYSNFNYDYKSHLKVVNTFYTSLQCDLQCKDIEDADLKAECQIEFCKEEDQEVK